MAFLFALLLGCGSVTSELSTDAGASCSPASVALTAGAVACDCGGTCGGCPVANAPTCGGTGLGHPNWTGCTVNGAPYVGCAQAADGAIGYCCANDCSSALCQTK